MQDVIKLYEKLRQPAFDRQRNDRSLSQFLEHRLLDIAKPFAPWQLPNEPTWSEDPYKDDTWGLYFHSLGWMVVLDHGIDSAGKREQQEYCARELRRLFFSYLQFLRDTSEDDLPKMAWFDHATAWRASAGAYLFEKRFKGDISEAERGLIEHFIWSHTARLKEFIHSGRWNANNHGLFHAEALWDMSKVFAQVPPGTDEFALAHMRAVFAEMIDFEEGVCREQSIYYHLFDASLLVASASYMGAFGVDVVPGYRDILVRMLDFYYACRADGVVIPAIGDTQYGKPSEDRLLKEIESSTSYQHKEAPTQLVEPELRSYPRSGYYFFRSDDANSQPVSAILLDKPYMGAHGHSDGGSVLLSRNGEPFLVDSGGPFAYGKALRFGYFKAAEAHNVALIGGKSTSYLTSVTSSSGNPLGKAVRIDTRDFPPGRWHRTLVAIRGGFYLLIDHVSLHEPDSIDVAFHLAPEIGVTKNGPAHHRLVGARSAIEMFHASNAGFEITENRGDAGFPRGLVTRELGKSEPATVVTARLRSHDAWLTTLIGPESTQAPQIHTLYGGKVVRVMIHGQQNIAVDCNISDSALPVNVYSFRPY